MVLEKFHGFLDSGCHSPGRCGVFLGYIVTRCVQVGKGRCRPFKSSHAYPGVENGNGLRMAPKVAPISSGKPFPDRLHLPLLDVEKLLNRLRRRKRFGSLGCLRNDARRSARSAETRVEIKIESLMIYSSSICIHCHHK
jgi:hypothetical protein